MKEIWKDVPGYEGLYQASNFGRVKRLDTILPDKNGKRVHKKGKILKPSTWHYKKTFTKHPGLVVNLWKNGQRKLMTVHRIIASTFILNPKNKPQVNHKDGNRENNRVDNLEWVTQEENMAHSVYVLNNQTYFPKKPIRCVETGDIFPSIASAAREYGLNTSTISSVVCHRPQHYTAAGFHWEYID